MKIETMRLIILSGDRFHRAPSQTGRAAFTASGSPARRLVCLGSVVRMIHDVLSPYDSSGREEFSLLPVLPCFSVLPFGVRVILRCGGLARLPWFHSTSLDS